MKIKVLSLNIEHGGVLMDALVPFLQAAGADILLLQEIHSGARRLPPRLRTLQYFGGLFDYPFVDFMPQYRDFDNTGDGSSYSGIAIMSRFPILSARHCYFDYPYTEDYRDSFEQAKYHPAALQAVQLNIGGQTVWAANVHGPWHLAGEEPTERRERMAEAIAEATAGKEKVIVAGDTNAKPHNPVFAKLEHLNSVFGGSLRTTFNMRRKTLPGYAEAAVDMMWVSPAVKVWEKDCPPADVSDHLPLCAVLEV